jgi:hypothetical protein
MKQFAFMIATTLLGVVGSFQVSPAWGVAVYYLYAVLRPQFIWQWMDVGGVQLTAVAWSFYVAIATLIATILWRTGSIAPSKATQTPWYGDPPYTRSHYLFLGFMFWVALSYPTAKSTATAYPWFIEYLKIFVMFVCATFVLRTVRDLWIIYLVITFGLGYAA